ncbi:GRP family sugar transporter [Fictibacillus iocasae]|uniref:GRP family sugar transporter n=1 Tax=Fictibacillus iocasae TaxID=2715437 RepID=A0ABW2NQK3_9BACL
MGIILALVTAVCWGSIVLLSEKLGGDEHSQTLGMTFGALIFAVVAYFITQPKLDSETFAVGLVSGLFWVIGQRNQFASVDHLGVSKIVPLSTGMQLFGTTLFGVLIFKEWETSREILIGVISIAAIIAGAVFTSLKDKNEQGKDSNYKKGLTVLLVSTVGFVGYVILIRWFEIDGWKAILPQAIGMLLGGMMLSLGHSAWNKFAVRNILTGFLWSTGNITLLLSLPMIGVATSFSLSQTGIVISTLGGIFILKEKKSKRQKLFIIIGLVLIVAGGVLLGYTKK